MASLIIDSYCDCVRTSEWTTLVALTYNPAHTTGTLLLDTDHQAQLYVKGVWVADLSAEDLFSGVDFVNLQLDRDRNAVPRPSEIDQLVL